MIERLLDITKTRLSPKDFHWPQSLFEKVIDAQILLDGGDFLLVKTEFFAPKLIKHSSWRTECVGDTYRRIFESVDNSKSFEDISRWFNTIMLPENYEPGKFSHQDYTLQISNRKNAAFVNLRKYPQGSYLIDLINAEVTIYDTMGNIANGGAVSSYTGGEENESLSLEKRTKTLEQLSKQNRLRQSKIVIQAIDGEYEAPFETGKMTFVNYENLSTLQSFDVSEDVTGKIHAADLSEMALQRVLNNFKYLLEECSVEYRK